MPSVTESSKYGSELNAALKDGVQSISRDQVVTFTQYTRTVLPLDGYIFWVKTGSTIQASGSLHYATELRQEEDETFAVDTVLFTAEQEIANLNAVSPGTLYVGEIDGLQFSFSQRSSFYEQAGVWHYIGKVVYPALASQLINSAADLPTAPIVSNSLPIWLGLTQYGTVYPSFLIPDNIVPPYIACHIVPESTTALQAFPVFNQGIVTNPTPPPDILIGTEIPNSGNSPLYYQPSSQLMRERVRLTLYGFTNQQAIQFMVYVNQYSLDTEDFGVCNMPSIQDDKRTQVEITALAQKKTLEYDINYYQATADAVAQRLILSAALSFTLTSTL